MLICLSWFALQSLDDFLGFIFFIVIELILFNCTLAFKDSPPAGSLRTTKINIYITIGLLAVVAVIVVLSMIVVLMKMMKASGNNCKCPFIVEYVHGYFASICCKTFS